MSALLFVAVTKCNKRSVRKVVGGGVNKFNDDYFFFEMGL